MTEKITNGELSAEIDSFGSQLISLKKGGVEYIWQRDPEFWDECAPILFPTIGRPKDDVLTIDGKDYPMPGHGFIRISELSLIDKTPDSVTYMLSDNDMTRELYPWSFKFYSKFIIRDGKLVNELTVENTDSCEIYFSLGGHPAFNVPMFEGEKFTDYKLEFEKEEVLESNIVADPVCILSQEKELILSEGRELPIKRSLFHNDAMIFERIQSDWVKLINGEGKGVKFYYKDFPTLAVWTRGEPSEAPFVCLEPWIGMAVRDNETGDIKDKYDIRCLKPEEKFTAEFSIEIID